MEDIATICLYVGNLELCLAINHDFPRIIFLSSLLGVEVGFVQYDTNLSPRRYTLGGLYELLVVVYRLNLTGDVASVWDNR